MAHSRLFGFLAITLCLVVCLCANADVSEDDAKKAVTEAQEYAKKVVTRAQGLYSDALYLSRETAKYKKEVERAATEAQKAAGGNSEAGKIAQEAKEAADKVTQAYPGVMKAIKIFCDAIMILRTQAGELAGRAENELKIGSTAESYRTAHAAALRLKAQVTALGETITAVLPLYRNAYSAQKGMPEDSKTAQLKKYLVDAIVAVAKFDPLLKEADSHIALIEEKRDAIESTVQEMNKLRVNPPKDALHYVETLYFYAQGNLKSASRSVEDAKKIKQEMLSEHAKANEALEKVKNETVVDDAIIEVEKAERYANAVAQRIEAIKKALKSAEVEAFNANARKNTAVSAINKRKNTSKPPVEDSKEGASKRGDEEQTRANTDTKKNSGEPVQDTTKSPGKGGKHLTSGTTDDSAMTVSVSLLLLLIACATLH